MRKQLYTVQFWATACTGSRETFTRKADAQKAIAEFIRDELANAGGRRSALRRQGNAYQDGSVTVYHKSGGQEFGAYIT